MRNLPDDLQAKFSGNGTMGEVPQDATAWRVRPVIVLVVRQFIFWIQSKCKYFLRFPRGIVVLRTSTVSSASLSMTYFSYVSHKRRNVSPVLIS